MKYSSELVKTWNKSYFDKEPVIINGLPNILWGVATDSGAELFNVLPHSEIALIYEWGNWLFIGKTLTQDEIRAAFVSGKFSAESVAASCLVEDLLKWIHEVNINQWSAMALMKLCSICHEYGMAETRCALTAIGNCSNLPCINLAINAIACSFDVDEVEYGTERWINKIVQYAFTSQF